MAFVSEINVNGFKVIGRSIKSFIMNLRIKNLIEGFSFIRNYPQPFISSLRSLYIFASICQVEAIIKQYDIVHIHGCSAITNATIKACLRQKVPFLVTLHGLNSFGNTINLHSSLRRYEREFLREAAHNNYYVSFISTGNMLMAKASMNVKADNFKVIPNGCDVRKTMPLEDIRKTYRIDSDDFVYAFVGNVSVNKNQIQVARAWKLLPDDIRKKCKVLFVGKYNEDDELVHYIRSNNLENNLILCGIQPKRIVAAFYKACNATILTSYAEGFGLSIIEGFVYGKPNLSFYDLPAINDLYDDKAMVLVRERSDEALAKAMVAMMQTSFDKNYIYALSQKFSFDIMAQKYHNLYSLIIK